MRRTPKFVSFSPTGKLTLDVRNLERELVRIESQIDELRMVADSTYADLTMAESAVVQGDLPDSCPDRDSIEDHLDYLQAEGDAAEDNLREQMVAHDLASADLRRLQQLLAEREVSL